MPVFLTGSTGYIGAHVAAELLQRHRERLNLLVRAENEEEGKRRLWKSLQLHMDFPQFSDWIESHVTVIPGDLTKKRFGLDEQAYQDLASTTESVVHCAASLNRKSEKTCLNVNLRGTLEVVKLGIRARDDHGLRRFSHVSTVAVAGVRSHEVVLEDGAIEWDRNDYDPYARTKKFCEHMIRELLPDVPRTIFRPSIVLGDSRRAETTQFDMVRAFVFLASLPTLPFRPDDQIDIVPVEYVAESVATIHQKDNPAFDIYHLSSGKGSQTFREVTGALAAWRGRRAPVFLPAFSGTFNSTVNGLARFKSTKIGRLATLLKVFLPYLLWNTVFDNERVVAEMGRSPARFSDYCYPLLKFGREHRFTYPYRDWPARAGGQPA